MTVIKVLRIFVRFNISATEILRNSTHLMNVIKQFLSNVQWIIQNKINVRFEVFMAVTMKNGVFWGDTPCDSCKNRRFRGTLRLLHQGDKNL
jgi:hypothetical protein